MDEQDEYEHGCGPASPFWHKRSVCEEAIHTLYHFIDGELTDDRRAAISIHLKECSPCEGAFDFEAELKTVISRKCRDTVPDELRQRIRQALIEASKRQPGAEYPPGMTPI